MEFAFNKIDIEPIFIIDYYLCQFSVKHILCKCTSVCWSSTNTYRYRSLVGPLPPPPNDQIGHMALNNNNSMTRRFGV